MKNEIKIYHNPRCRKSREGLQFLRENGIEPEIMEYLKEPLTKPEIIELSKKLGMRPKDFIRKQENEFKEQNLKNEIENDDKLFNAMESFPKLIERPIVVSCNSAVLGRPVENLKDIL